MKYLFILGRDKELSKLELRAFFRSKNIAAKKLIDKEHLVYEIRDIDPGIIKELGGVVKIGAVMESFDEIEIKSDKMKYAISVYNGEDVKDGIKKFFKKEKVKAILKKPKREEWLMPSEVIKNRLIEEGVEILVYENIIARTIVVTDVLEVEKRDNERPEKDYLKNISIRLAKILVNLSEAKKEVLDPFCGYGIILQEAMLKGLNVKGLDIDDKSVKAAKKNIEWAMKRYKKRVKSEIKKGDSRKISSYFKKTEAVATEPYLGPYIKKLPDKKEAEKIVIMLENLYRKFISELKLILYGKAAIIVPVIITKDRKKYNIEIKEIANENKMKIEAGPVNYGEGKIEREIWVIS